MLYLFSMSLRYGYSTSASINSERKRAAGGDCIRERLG